jgi:hypothetical protein
MKDSKFIKSLPVAVLFLFSVVFYGLYAQDLPIEENIGTFTEEEVLSMPEEEISIIEESKPTTVEQDLPAVEEEKVIPLEEFVEEQNPIEPIIPIKITSPRPLIPSRGEVSKEKKDIDYSNSSYLCNVSPFVLNVSSGSANAIVNIKNIDKVGSQNRQIIIGELPYGVKVVFANNTFKQNVIGEITTFPISIVRADYAQKGTFVVPIFYSIGEKNVVCQMTIINNG